jgi:hypothetical protein
VRGSIFGGVWPMIVVGSGQRNRHSWALWRLDEGVYLYVSSCICELHLCSCMIDAKRHEMQARMVKDGDGLWNCWCR